MFITIHAAAATLIGAQTDNAAIAFGLGVVSHFILDMIPHGDMELGKRFFGLKISNLREENKLKTMALYGSMDACTMVLLLVFLFKNFDFARSDGVSWAIIGGILPDFLVGFYQLTKFKYIKWIYKFHHWNHFLILNKLKKDLPIKYGIIMQATVLVAIVCLLYFS